jgi:N-acylglucosamine 2-epimerase
MHQYAQLYQNELLNNIVPFWQQHSVDREQGGFFTCLDQFGKVYDTDKFIWLQGRETWCFAMLYNNVEQKQEWLDMALHGAKFLMEKAHDAEGNFYFSCNQQGQPLVQPYNIFSDCFACMAFAQLYKATKEQQYADWAVRTFNNILKRQHDWKGQWSKAYPGTRPMKNFSLPMILCNLSLELESLLDSQLVNETIETVVHEVMNVFYQPQHDLIVENVAPDGQLVDCFEGRLLNPGHAIEAMWFIMDLAKRNNNQSLVQQALNIMLRTIQHGWDKTHGGILYFLDLYGHPPQQLEWDQKLWWVHVETLVGLAKGYAITKDERCEQWFHKVHDYSWGKFKDPAYKEWFGYLNREGNVLLPLKGGKWKGCFHMPRAMFQVWKTLETI